MVNSLNGTILKLTFSQLANFNLRKGKAYCEKFVTYSNKKDL
jgi:hypothetical protein